MKNNSVIKPFIALICMALFLAFCFDLTVESIRSYSFAFLVITTVIILIAFRKNLPSTPVFYTVISGMFLKLAYVLYTPVWCRQHDFIDFGATEGHAAYMEYILSHKALPDFDPREVWAFFQPPLHHIISACWMWINIRLGVAENHMRKNVQILPLFYMCALMIFVYLITRELNMRKEAVLVTMLLTSFHPVCILMSGSLNNDALSVLLTVMAVYFAILWYMYPTTGKIIMLAAAIGSAMMAKLSSALVAPGIGAMMIYKMVKDTNGLKEKPKVISYILELIPFALIVFPLGLWWPVRNKLMFDMPVGYIPAVGEDVGGISMLYRLFDVRTASPFLYMKSNGYQYNEYNLILATIKSSLFGEGAFENISPVLTIAAWILLALCVIIIVLSFAALIRTCFSKEAGPDNGIKILLGVSVLTFVAGYIWFALKGANLSAMDYRYAAASVSMLAVFLGLWYDRLSLTGKNKTRIVVMGTSVAFAAAAAVVYIMVGVFAP